MVAVPDVATGGILVYGAGLHLYLAYLLGKRAAGEDTLSATEADLTDQG
jgi:hypothetical protein